MTFEPGIEDVFEKRRTVNQHLPEKKNNVHRFISPICTLVKEEKEHYFTGSYQSYISMATFLNGVSTE